MTGFGDSAIGTGPFGLETPAAAPEKPKGSTGVRYINPLNKQYEHNSTTGNFKQMPEIRQRVLLALSETMGSSSVRPNDGLRVPKKIGTNFVGEVTTAVRLALRRLIEIERVISLDTIDVEQTGMDRGSVTVVYTDLTTNRPDQVTIQ